MGVQFSRLGRRRTGICTTPVTLSKIFSFLFLLFLLEGLYLSFEQKQTIPNVCMIDGGMQAGICQLLGLMSNGYLVIFDDHIK